METFARSYISLGLMIILFTTLVFSQVLSSINSQKSRKISVLKSPLRCDHIKKRFPPVQLFGSEEQEDVRVPFKALFIVHPSAKKENKEILDQVFPLVNARVEKMMKGPPLTNLRFHRTYDSSKKRCDPANAGGMLVPEEFARPCYDDQGVYVPEVGVTKEPSPRVSDLTKKNYNVVVCVAIYNDTVPSDNQECIGVAALGDSTALASTGRPTHGVIILCYPPYTYADKKNLENTILHELIHVLDVDYSGGHSIAMSPCADDPGDKLESCKDVTWKTVDIEWLHSNNTKTNRTLALSLLPSVVQAAKHYFKCDSIDGMEFDGEWLTGNDTVDRQRDFDKWHLADIMPQEVMAGYSDDDRFSAVTLAVLKDSQWYDVDMSKAEPTTYGPVFPMCDVTKKSCHQIIMEAQLKKDESAMIVNPYCIDKKSPLCSTDGRSMLRCNNDTEALCPMLSLAEWNYEYAHCDRNTKWTVNSMNEKFYGSRIGRGTMCVTFTKYAAWKDEPDEILPMCVEFKCQHSKKRIALKLYPNGDSFKIKHHQFSGQCNVILKGSISYWCSNYNEVCPTAPKVKQNVTTTTESQIQLAVHNVKLDFVVQHQQHCKMITLEAFKQLEVTTLRWYYFGYPEFQNCGNNRLFIFGKERIHGCIALIDSAKTQTLFKAAKKRYPNDDVRVENIQAMPLENLTCETSVWVNRKMRTMRSIAFPIRINPSVLTFKFEEAPDVRAKFESNNDHIFHCYLVTRTNPIVTRKYEIIVIGSTVGLAPKCTTTTGATSSISTISTVSSIFDQKTIKRAFIAVSSTSTTSTTTSTIPTVSLTKPKTDIATVSSSNLTSVGQNQYQAEVDMFLQGRESGQSGRVINNAIIAGCCVAALLEILRD